MELVDGSKHFGKFMVDGRSIFGELTINSEKTSLYLHDEKEFDPNSVNGGFVYGMLHDFTKVALVNCVAPPVACDAWSAEDGTYFSADIFPHFILYGYEKFDLVDADVCQVSFAIDDINKLFYDFDAFGASSAPDKFIEEIIKSEEGRRNRSIPAGPRPQVLYFCGRTELAEVETCLGHISVSHWPNPGMGGPDGVAIKNAIRVTIRFTSAVTFGEAISRIIRASEFFGLLCGRAQEISGLMIKINGEKYLRVYWSDPPRRISSFSNPHCADLLIRAADNPSAFSNVAKGWFDAQAARQEARGRFFSRFADQALYTVDRLISAANMFDILPKDSVPYVVPLSDELAEAKKKSMEIFKKLPISLERDAALGNLGRLGRSSLKHKVRHRGQIVLDVADGSFPDLFVVVDAAVDARNFYVHGGDAKVNYSQHGDLMIFMVDTLEFIFAASDLIDAGWCFRSWRANGSSLSHPFARYCHAYAVRLEQAKTSLGLNG